MNKSSVPVWEKMLLTADEAAFLTNIGTARLRELAKAAPHLVVYAGTKCLFKRKKLEQYLDSTFAV